MVVLFDGSFESVFEDENKVMAITESDYDDLVDGNIKIADLPHARTVGLAEMIECWNAHNPDRRLDD